MRVLHLAFGAFVIAAFLLTGQFMDHALAHLEGMPDGPRMLYRTRHIFIMFSALLHLAVGAYVRPGRRRRSRAFQFCGSALLTLAPILFVAAFFYEPTLGDLETPLSHWGAYLTVAGVMLHLAGGAGEGKGAGEPLR